MKACIHKHGYRLLAPGLLSLLAVPRLPAQTPPASSLVLTEEPHWHAICKAAIAQPLPAAAEALAQAASRAETVPCQETRPYYGFEKPPNYRAALRCAYLYRAHPGMPSEDFIEGPAVLSMLYANGYGVARNYNLAIRFECEAAGDIDSEESSLSIGRLEALRDGKQSHSQPFDLCQDAISGARGSYCQSISEEEADVGRAGELKQLRARLPSPAQAPFLRLQMAETTFEQARGKDEYTGGGGSGSAGFEELDQGNLREQFLINLRRFAAGDLPRATAADRARAEQRMQAAYAAEQESAPPSNSPNRNLGAPDPDKAGFARAQRAWELLFAAWMRFVPVAYPALSPDTAATELLRLRIHQLK